MLERIRVAPAAAKGRLLSGLLMPITLIVTPKGFSLAYELTADDMSDKSTLKGMMERIEAHNVAGVSDVLSRSLGMSLEEQL